MGNLCDAELSFTKIVFKNVSVTLQIFLTFLKKKKGIPLCDGNPLVLQSFIPRDTVPREGQCFDNCGYHWFSLNILRSQLPRDHSWHFYTSHQRDNSYHLGYAY